MYTYATTLSDSTIEEKAVDIVWKRVNSLYGETSKNDVLKVINRYVRKLKNNPAIPIYNTYYVETVPKPEYFQTATDVAHMAGVTIELARKILKQLEYADKDGSIPKGVYNPRVEPKTTKVSIEQPKMDTVEQTEEPGPQEDSNLSDILKWSAIGVGSIGLGVFLLNKSNKRKK